MTVQEIAEEYPEIKDDIIIVDAFSKANSILKTHTNIFVSISGGGDSDIILDIIERCKYPSNNVYYGFFDTGLELQATKNHLDYLEKKYSIEIERIKPAINVPKSIRLNGVPLINKNISYNLSMLQKRGWFPTYEPYNVLIEKYPKSMTGIKWWTNWYHSKWDTEDNTSFTQTQTFYNICRNRYLKEYMIAHPIDFPISDKCCVEAKEKVARQTIKKYNIDLNIIGLRKAERRKKVCNE